MDEYADLTPLQRAMVASAHDSHGMEDGDLHFVIDPITKLIRNQSEKVKLMQYDHNSECFTFEMPKDIEGHDMTLCNEIQVHYINIGKNESNAGIYEVTDITVCSDEPDKVTFSWLISQNATKLVGTLNFLVRFCCVNEDDAILEYVWQTDIFSNITIASSIYNSEIVIEEYVDVLEQWKQEVILEIEQSIPIASSEQLGLVKPVAKTDDMVSNVGVDSYGRLYSQNILCNWDQSDTQARDYVKNKPFYDKLSAHVPLAGSNYPSKRKGIDVTLWNTLKNWTYSSCVTVNGISVEKRNVNGAFVTYDILEDNPETQLRLVVCRTINIAYVTHDGLDEDYVSDENSYKVESTYVQTLHRKYVPELYRVNTGEEIIANGKIEFNISEYSNLGITVSYSATYERYTLKNANYQFVRCPLYIDTIYELTTTDLGTVSTFDILDDNVALLKKSKAQEGYFVKLNLNGVNYTVPLLNKGEKESDDVFTLYFLGQLITIEGYIYQVILEHQYEVDTFKSNTAKIKVTRIM